MQFGPLVSAVLSTCNTLSYLHKSINLCLSNTILWEWFLIVESVPKMCLYSWSALPVSIILASPFSSTCRCPCKSSQTLMAAKSNFNWTVKKSNVYPINVFDVDISLFNKDFHYIHPLSCSCHMQCSSLRRKRNYVRQKSTYLQCTLEVQVSEQNKLWYIVWFCSLRTPIPNLHNDVTYKSWSKTSAGGHREYIGYSKCVFRKSTSLLCRKMDCLCELVIATWRVGVFISVSDGCIAVQC